MKLSWIDYKRLGLDGFILFILFSFFVLLYERANPYAYPGIEPKICIVFAAYMILLFPMYFQEIVYGFASLRARLERWSIPAVTKISTYFRKISIIASFIKNRYYKKSTPTFRNYKKSTPTFRMKEFTRYSREDYFKIVSGLVFQVLLVAFLFALLLQQFKSDLVEHYINLTYFLILVIFSGIISILAAGEEKNPNPSEPMTKDDYVLVALAGVVGAALVWYKIQDMGLLSYFIALISGVLITLLSILVLSEEEEKKTL